MSALRRVAVIDCGTNTFNLRIVDVGAAAGWRGRAAAAAACTAGG